MLPFVAVNVVHIQCGAEDIFRHPASGNSDGIYTVSHALAAKTL